MSARISLAALACAGASWCASAFGQVAPSVPPPPRVTFLPWTTGVAIDVSAARPPVASARLANLSIRASVGGAANPIIAGAVVEGSGSLPMLVRAVGPTLTTFGVSNALRDPAVEIHAGDTIAARATAASADATAIFKYVGAFPLPGVAADGSSDAAIAGSAGAGALTVHAVSRSGASGVALLEFYDASPTTGTAPRFANFSARARVESGDGMVVIGFVVAGPGECRLLLRGVGPTLQALGVTDVLADPMIELFSGSTLMASNDNWGNDAAAALATADAASGVGAFPLSNPKDAALIATLPAGAYTLRVRGASGQTGAALGEIYELASTSFDAARSTNAVGLDLFRQLSGRTAGTNLILSPYSIESALALAYAGAAGDTRAEMAAVLRLPADNTALQAGFAALRSTLDLAARQSQPIAAARSKSGATTDPIDWAQANRLFGQQGYAFRDSFLTLMSDGFAAPFVPLDFRSNAESSRVFVNGWVEDQTRQRIQNLIPAGALDASTRLVLVNALYLKAPWDVTFDKTSTVARPFNLTPTSAAAVPTMFADLRAGYVEESGLAVLSLNYLGGGLQFVVILPSGDETVDAAAARLTTEQLTRWSRLGDTNSREVLLYLPKFKVAGSTVALGAALRTLGMKQAFDIPIGTANFDGIAPRTPADYLSISDVFHQTFVAVDEQGTEAAAATAVVISTTSVQLNPPPIVRVDRPFLFAIQDRATGALLFLGRITDPR